MESIFKSSFFYLVLLVVGVAGLKAVGADSSEIAFKGYLDIQHRWQRGNIEVQDGVILPGSPNEFAIHKGSFELARRQGRSEFLLDIPIHQTRDNPDSNNSLDLATERAQAYIKMTYSQNWQWMIGQFDTPFGLEGNDTNTIMYRNLGIVYGVTPNTHTGFLARRTWSQWWLFLMAGNANQYGAQSSDYETELGIKAGFENEEDGVFFNLGVLSNQQKGEYSVLGQVSSYERGYLIDLQTGIDVGDTSLVINAVYVLPGQEFVLEEGQRKERDSTVGLMASLESQLTERWRVGLRYEFLDNDNTNELVSDGSVAGTGNGSKLQKVSLGLKKQMDSQLSFKTTVDLLALNVGAGGKDVSWTEGAAALLYNF